MARVIFHVIGLALVVAVLALRAVEVAGSEEGLWPSEASIGADGF